MSGSAGTAIMKLAGKPAPRVPGYRSGYRLGGRSRKRRYMMIGAIIGDVAGSRFEWDNHKSKNF